VLLAALAAAVFGWHVFNGGFISDDWEVAAYTQNLGYADSVDYFFDTLGSKPLLAVLLPIPHAVFGSTTELHLALALVLGALTAALFYMVLRTLGLERRHAGVIAALALIFPWADSIRLWATASINNVAVCLYLAGLLVAFRGLRDTGRRSALIHGAAVLLYALSVLTYEIVAVAALLSAPLYALRAPWRRVFPRWAADVAGVGAALIYTAATTVKETAPVETQLRHLGTMVGDAAELVALSVVPIGPVPRAPVVALILIVLGAGVVLLRRGGIPRAVARELRRWLWVALAALVALCASYAMVVPGAYFTSLSPGLLNRVNIVATLPIAVFVYATVMVAALLALRRSPRWRTVSTGVAVAASVLIAVGYIVRDATDESHWDDASDEQVRILETMEKVVPSPPGDSTIYTFGHRSEVATWVPVFNETWDLNSAVRLVYRDMSLESYPVFEGARFSCEKNWLKPESLPTRYRNLDPLENSDDARVAYGKALFVDVRAESQQVIRGRSQCVAAVRGSSPGPIR
jgi:hypothetical protein